MKINLSCCINSTGYGIASTEILSALVKNGVDVALFPINPYNMEADYRHHQNIQTALGNTNLFNPSAPTLRIYHQFSMAESIGRGRRIGLPFFELDRFNDIEKHHLKSLDTVLSASKWAADIVKKECDLSSPVVPMGVDTTIFKPTPIHKSDKTIFIVAGKWEKRKHSTIIEAFEKAFKPTDNFALWMFCDNPVKPDENQLWEKKFRSSKFGDKVLFVHRKLQHSDVYDVMRYAHFGVFPTRGEGWNLEALEMLSIGRKIIATNYSAHTEFLDKDNAILLDGDGLEPANDGIWFHGQGNWLKLEEGFIDRFALSLRECYEQHQSSKDIFNHAGVETANKFTWDNTALKIIDVLREV